MDVPQMLQLELSATIQVLELRQQEAEASDAAESPVQTGRCAEYSRTFECI